VRLKLPQPPPQSNLFHKDKRKGDESRANECVKWSYFFLAFAFSSAEREGHRREREEFEDASSHPLLESLGLSLVPAAAGAAARRRQAGRLRLRTYRREEFSSLTTNGGCISHLEISTDGGAAAFG
jgi:hypothetical protein